MIFFMLNNSSLSHLAIISSPRQNKGGEKEIMLPALKIWD